MEKLISIISYTFIFTLLIFMMILMSKILFAGEPGEKQAIKKQMISSFSRKDRLRESWDTFWKK